MKALKTLSILTLISVSITILCAFGQADSGIIGFWAFVTFGLAIAQSIVGLVQANKHKQ
jgi:hypothetical protein